MLWVRDRVNFRSCTLQKEKAMPNLLVITDCHDENARLRQVARYAAYFPGWNITFAGVNSDVEAAFMLIDALDALDGHFAVIIVNVAPRNGAAKKHANGTPFGLIEAGQAKIFSSIDGATLRLLNKIMPGLTLHVYDIPEVVPHLTSDVELQRHITTTQFRSFEFLPRVAKAVVIDGKTLPGRFITLTDHCGEEGLGVVSFIDCFGNLKTTLLPEEVGFEAGKSVNLEVGGSTTHRVTCYTRLKDIPDGELGLAIGSSGLGRHRFLELMCQGGNAGRLLDAKVGISIRAIVSHPAIELVPHGWEFVADVAASVK